MIVKLAQLIVTRDIETNFHKIIHVLNSAKEQEWIIFPEGMLSGYYPEEKTFLEQLDFEKIQKYLDQIKSKVTEKKCLCIFGSAYRSDNKWYNSSIFLDETQMLIYHKNNLAMLDRSHFHQGNSIETYKSRGVVFGIQMCRELVFPEQWKLLKHQGAQIIFHINNSIKVSDEVRKHLLIARAFENQYYICSVNNADKPQTMASYVISPTGEVIYESTPQEEIENTVTLDLVQVDDTYLSQERSDLVKLVLLEYKN